MHRITLKQMTMILHKKDQDLINEWNLRNHNYDPNVLFATILSKGESFGVLEQNPILFKYKSDAWWEKHRRTFEKWFDAFDIPYAPLENYGKYEQITANSNEDTNTYNKYKDTSDNTSTHIGDTFANEDLAETNLEKLSSAELMDNDITKSARLYEDSVSDTLMNNSTQQLFDEDTTNSRDYNEGSTVTSDGSKEALDNHDFSRTLSTVEQGSGSGESSGSMSNSEASGKLIPEKYDEYGNVTKWKIDPKTERSVENRVSAYNENDMPVNEEQYRLPYAPNQLTITHGQMSNSGSNSGNTSYKADNTTLSDEAYTADNHDYNEIHNDSGSTSTNGLEELTGTRDTSIDSTTNEISNNKNKLNRGVDEINTNDTTTDIAVDNISTNNKNTQNIEKEKFNDSSITQNAGDSTTATGAQQKFEQLNYAHGNIGVTLNQKMLTEEIKVQMFTIYDAMAELFVDEMCVRIYLSNRQRGGCCLW